MHISHVTVVVNRRKAPAAEAGDHVREYLRGFGVRAELVEMDDLLGGGPADWASATDLIITLGGDGTILAASRIAAPHATPILGVHMGRFGFIAEAHPGRLDERLDDVLAGRYDVEERVMVHGEVRRQDMPVHEAIGLNDVVISKGAMTRMLHLTIRFGDGPVMDYVADGVIVATPTGSTAYALSAGGPLMDPTVRALLVAPICPHTLAARPLVVQDTQQIELAADSDGGEVKFSADSTSVFALIGGDRVSVRRAEHPTRLVVFHRDAFYHKVHGRLLWGERVNE